MTAAAYAAATASPLRSHDGYPPLEDVGLVGDSTTAALVARDGAVVWLCVPRFDSEPLFCSLLDRCRGGAFRIAPEDIVEARQRYEPDSGVLVTELRAPTGWSGSPTASRFAPVPIWSSIGISATTCRE